MSIWDLMIVFATVLAFVGSVTLIVVVVEKLWGAQPVNSADERPDYVSAKIQES